MMPRNDSAFPDAGDQSSSRPDINPVPGRIDPQFAQPVVQRSESGLPPALNSGPDAMALLRGLGRRWLTAVTLGTLLALVGAAGAYYLLSPKHTASSQIRVLYIDPIIGKPVTNPSAFTTLVKSQASLLTSRPIIKDALKFDEMKRLDLGSKYPDVEAHLAEELKVETTEGSEFLTLTYSCNDANQAKVVVKAITDAYIAYQKYFDHGAKTVNIVEVEKAYNEARKKLEEKTKSLADATRDNGSDSESLQRQAEELRIALRELGANRRALALKRTELEGELQAADIRLEATKAIVIPEADVQKALEMDLKGKALLYDLAKYEKVASDYEASGSGLNTPTYLRAKDVVDRVKPQVEKRRAELRAEMTKRLGDVAEIDAKLNKETRKYQLAALGNTIKEADKQYEDLSKKVVASGKLPGAIDAAKHEIDQAQLQVDNLANQLQELQMLLRSQDRIFVYAEADLQKRDTKKQLLGTIAAPTGIFGMVCMLLAYGDYRQRRVRSARDMANGLGIPVFGTVPEVKNPERHLIGPVTDPDIDAQPVLESIDALRTQLLHSSSMESCRVVLVTSAVSGEGKTTVASHLATSLARAGRKTVLVDADLRRPALHQLFELPQQPGLSEVLLGEVESADAIQPTTLDGLSVVTAGQWDRDVMQALARGGLAAVFEKLRQEFDFVIIDSHPVLAATDSLVIAQQVEGVILSVRRDLSQTPRVYAAQQKLASLRVRLLGAVLSGGDPMEIYGSPAAAPVPAA